MPTLIACLWRRVKATQPGRVPTHFGPATRLRRPESQGNQGALATSQVEMCPRTANSGRALRPKKASKLWIWKALERDTGRLIDWECGDRDRVTLEPLLGRLE